MKSLEIKNFFKTVELFCGLDSNELNQILNLFEKRTYDKNSFLFKELSLRKNLFIIYSGEVEVLQRFRGKLRRLIVFGKGDYLGEGALLDQYPHSTSARALKQSVLFLIDKEKFAGLLESNPQTAGKILSAIIKVISRRTREPGNFVPSVGLQYLSGKKRLEHDLLGEREVPHEAYYGIQTLRALENFPITGVPISHYPHLIEALAIVKLAAVRSNVDLKLISNKTGKAIEQTCLEIIKGRFHSNFVVDVIQGGAGTSTNMNANEVIANRALEIMGKMKGDYNYCHPNNHVNLSQSTNDAYPTALKIAILMSNKKLTQILSLLSRELRKKSEEFRDVIKMGRTQLQDAVPMTLGQEFEAYSVTVDEEVERLKRIAGLFLEVNMGGTAIGTGINAHPGYRKKVIENLKKITGLKITAALNLVEATQDTGSFVLYSSALKRLAVKLSKIASDLRLLSSGPRTGFNEINLPPVQPGSSIMPGKVNPVIPEVLNQICYKVIGNDLSVTLGAEAGQLELNVMEPLIAQSIFESVEILSNGITTFIDKCITGITANRERCRDMVYSSIGLVTALVPLLGYEKCTEIALEALNKNKGVYDLVLEKKLISRSRLDKLLKPENMVG